MLFLKKLIKDKEDVCVQLMVVFDFLETECNFLPSFGSVRPFGSVRSVRSVRPSVRRFPDPEEEEEERLFSSIQVCCWFFFCLRVRFIRAGFPIAPAAAAVCHRTPVLLPLFCLLFPLLLLRLLVLGRRRFPPPLHHTHTHTHRHTQKRIGCSRKPQIRFCLLLLMPVFQRCKKVPTQLFAMWRNHFLQQKIAIGRHQLEYWQNLFSFGNSTDFGNVPHGVVCFMQSCLFHPALERRRRRRQTDNLRIVRVCMWNSSSWWWRGRRSEGKKRGLFRWLRSHAIGISTQICTFFTTTRPPPKSKITEIIIVIMTSLSRGLSKGKEKEKKVKEEGAKCIFLLFKLDMEGCSTFIEHHTAHTGNQKPLRFAGWMDGPFCRYMLYTHTHKKKKKKKKVYCYTHSWKNAHFPSRHKLQQHLPPPGKKEEREREGGKRSYMVTKHAHCCCCCLDWLSGVRTRCWWQSFPMVMTGKERKEQSLAALNVERKKEGKEWRKEAKGGRETVCVYSMCIRVSSYRVDQQKKNLLSFSFPPPQMYPCLLSQADRWAYQILPPIGPRKCL